MKGSPSFSRTFCFRERGRRKGEREKEEEEEEGGRERETDAQMEQASRMKVGLLSSLYGTVWLTGS